MSEMVGVVDSVNNGDDPSLRQAMGEDAIIVDFWTILPHILCDYCNQPLEINLRCSMCKCVYYCSKECSSKDWKKEHKIICKSLLAHIEDINQKNLKLSTVLLMKIKRQNNARLQDDECCICLEKMTDPLIVNCDHLFCLKCLFDHHSNADSRCPLCRSDILNEERMIHHYVYKTAVEFLKLAQAKLRGSEERRMLCHAATTQLTYIQRLKNYYKEFLLVDFNADDYVTDYAVKSLDAQFAQVEFVSYVSLVEILFCEGNFNDCADKARERLNEYFSATATDKASNNSINRGLEKLIEIYIDALIELKQFVEAKKYVLLCGQTLSGADGNKYIKTKAYRKLYEQYSIVLHGLGSYDESINYCNMAIEANRHYYNVYDCLVKNYEAKGEIDKMISVLNKAIKYETPWDGTVAERHRETLKKLQEQSR